MRKTLVYFVILILLGFAVYYFLFNNKQETLYSPAEAGFTIKDTGSIGKIFLAANDGEDVTLERTDSGWMVNKLYRAMPSTLNLLLITLNQQAALYPVTQNAHDNAIKNLSAGGIKVEVYGRDGKKMRVFYVGGAALNNSGSNMLMEGATRPFVVQVPSFNGYLSARYPVKLRDWRDRTIFNFRPEDIKTISVQYPNRPENSFEISMAGSESTVKTDVKPGPLNPKRVNMYLKLFGNVSSEGYLNGLEDMDTTIKNAPKHSSLDVQTINGRHQHVDIYWMAINRRSKNLTVSNPGVPDDFDADRLYAVINDNKDTVMIQNYVFNGIFRKGREFYENDTTKAQPSILMPMKKN